MVKAAKESGSSSVGLVIAGLALAAAVLYGARLSSEASEPSAPPPATVIPPPPTGVDPAIAAATAAAASRKEAERRSAAASAAQSARQSARAAASAPAQEKRVHPRRAALSGGGAVHLPFKITRQPSSENPHWSLQEMLQNERKIFLTGEIEAEYVDTFVVRASLAQKVTAFAVATADIMGSAYREEVRIMEVLPMGKPRRTLVQWGEYGSIPRGRDQAQPGEYTPQVIAVETEAIEFEVSLRHHYRGHGVAAPGLAILRAEGIALTAPAAA